MGIYIIMLEVNMKLVKKVLSLEILSYKGEIELVEEI